VCQGQGWTPSDGLKYAVIRAMLAQGMLDDYLLTGDPAARAAVLGMGEAYLRSLPALTSGPRPPIEESERNLGWVIMGLSAYHALDPNPAVLQALRGLIDRTLAWQARGSSGSFEHDLARIDPDECSSGPRGASPFMTGLLIDGVMDYWFLTHDQRIPDLVRRTADWLMKDAVDGGGRAFQYLWHCDTRSYDGFAELNMLIVPVLGAAYHLTGDSKYIEAGDRFADEGVDGMSVDGPKQWSQSARSFANYLGFRAAPPITKQ
jgi:hypothetical protein